MEFLDFMNRQSGAIIAMANIILALGTIVLALGIPWSIRSGARDERDTFYATLDETYFEIQKLVIEHPHLSNPDPAGKTHDQVIQYNAFAFMMWNFMESIVDYSKNEKFLADTWGCVLRHETAQHGVWFAKPENQGKFKKDFIAHITNGNFLPDDGDLNM